MCWENVLGWMLLGSISPLCAEGINYYPSVFGSLAWSVKTLGCFLTPSETSTGWDARKDTSMKSPKERQPRKRQDVCNLMRTYTLVHRRVWHIGTLDSAEKGTDSHHGDGLAISLHPDIWREIARLAGGQIRLQKENATFVDMLTCLRDARVMREVWAWSLEQGYVERGPVYTVHYYDSEDEEWHRIPFLKEEVARAEYVGMDLPSRQKRYSVKSETNRSTERMRQRAMHSTSPLAFVNDFALLFFIEDHLSEVDGVWWNHILDPLRLSAPFGTIFQAKLSSWSHCKEEA